MGLSRADPMVGVLVDACGWVSLVDAGLNLDISLNETIGEAELKITDSVRRELDSLAGSRGGLLLDLLYSRAEVVKSDEGHTDTNLVEISIDTGWPVLTVDRGLKRKLVERGCSFIEVTSGPSLRLVEA
jgi:rRNA-processing protein FCF1